MSGNDVHIVFDTETVGLDASDTGCQILTISAGVLDSESGTVVVEFNQYCDLTSCVEAKMQSEDYLGADTEVRYATVRDCLERSGWSKTEQRDGTEREVLTNFYAYVTQHPDCKLMAYNAAFDMRWVNNRLKHYGLPPIMCSVIDVMETARLELEPVLDERMDNGDQLSRQMLKQVTFHTEKRTWRSFTLENVAKMFGVHSLEAHESQADIVMAGKVYLKIKQFVGDCSPSPVYRARSLRKMRDLCSYFRSEGNWNRIHSRKCKKLLKLCLQNHMLAACSYRDFLLAELKREQRRNRDGERRSRMILDNLLALYEIIELKKDKRSVAKLIYFGML